MVVLHNRGRNQYAQEQPRFDDVALDDQRNRCSVWTHLHIRDKDH
ncbi:hypothetical protein T4B_496 [Trichinella pseudospiralis]|uniref:Uncharacterized protein n=1 Tax=Trichinella pseudospiralis TaxID=6337 RepID=A0A0V1ID85_TRIPS|nr:hypothetical protein T4B_496 [Trichinella pseudospiralis]